MSVVISQGYWRVFLSALRPVIEQIFSIVRGMVWIQSRMQSVRFGQELVVINNAGSGIYKCSCRVGATVDTSSLPLQNIRDRSETQSSMYDLCLAETALISGMLAPMIQALSDAFRAAMKDGIITPASSQTNRKSTLLQVATNQALAFLTPVIDALAALGIIYISNSLVLK